MNQTIDPESNSELNPEVMYKAIDEKKYKFEMEIYDRWMSFSAELISLGLLGIAAIGFLYEKVLAGFDRVNNPSVPIDFVELLSVLSVVAFALSTVIALYYRYGSTVAMGHYLKGLRNSVAAKEELEQRDRRLRKCVTAKWLSASCLGAGSGLSAFAIILLFL